MNTSPSSSLVSFSGFGRTLAAISISLGTFMQVLDSTIANVSLHTISGNLGVSSSQGTWIVTAFAAANGVSVPITGWLMGRYGVVKTFITSVLLFTIASLLCALSWNIGSMVLFRTLQGLAAGPMIPGSQILLTAIFPPQQRGLALTIWMMVSMVAPVCGPLFGGFICDNWTWPWIFLINIPTSIACAVGCGHYLVSLKTPTRKLPIDGIGFGLLSVWVGALQVMLDQGKDADWFASSLIVGLAAVTVVGFANFVVWELTDRHPIVDVKLCGRPNFLLGTVGFSVNFAFYIANMLLVTLWLQTRLGYTATWAGLVLVPIAGIPVILGIPGIKLMERIGPRWAATLSLLAMATGFYARAALSPTASFFNLVLPMAMTGLGVTLFFTSMMTVALEDLSPAQMASGAGLLNFARMTASAFATSLVSTLWERRETLHQTRLSEQSSLFNPLWAEAIDHLQTLGFGPDGSAAALYRSLADQAYALVFIDVSWLLACLTILLIPLIWIGRSSAVVNGKSDMN